MLQRVGGTFLAVALAAAAMLPSPAFAQSYGDDRFDPTLGFFDVEPYVPENVPDRNGCVKICFRDVSPCDPIQYKRVDGRCSHKNS